MDLSKLSNEDLLALHNKQYDKLSNEGLIALHEQNQAQESTPQQPSTLSKAAHFIGNLPQSAIDLVPGMQEKRQINDTAKEEFYKTHPKPQTGQDDPAYQALGLVGPESGVKMISSAGKGLAKFLEPALARREVLSHVKDLPSLEPYVASKVNDAAELFNKKQIAPRMLEQNARMDGQSIKLNPEELMGISPEIDTMAKNLSSPGTTLSEIPAQDAMKIRAELNKVAGWKTHPVDPTKAQAMDAKVADLHQKIANGLSSVDPAMADLSSEMKDAYNLKNQVLGKNSRNPLATVSTNDNVAGIAKKGRLQAFDKQSDSNLSELGNNIKSANDKIRPMTLSDVFSIHGPKQLVSKTVGKIPSAYDAMSSAQMSSPDLSGADKLKALLLKYSAVQGSDGNSGI